MTVGLAPTFNYVIEMLIRESKKPVVYVNHCVLYIYILSDFEVEDKH